MTRSTSGAPMRRRMLLALVLGGSLAACAGMGARSPLNVTVAGLEPLQGEGLEARFLVKLRVQNAGDTAIAFDGVAVELDLNGRSFAQGVSDQKGVVPRFGEALFEVPVTVPASAMVRQVLALMSGGDHSNIAYRVRGFLGSGAFGGSRFDSSGELALPAGRAAGG